MATAVLAAYKAFVRSHPSLVVNAERLLHWLVWNPERFSGSEYAYEAFNAAVGLLGIYNDSILQERPGQEALASWALALSAVEQAQTLVELRAIHLEQRGKMSRYGPLVALELVKCALRLALWRASQCKLALAEVGREDEEQQECEAQFKELLQALIRLRAAHSYDPVTAPTSEHMQYNAHLAHAAAVRAAAVAPHRPPAACAVGAGGGAVGISAPPPPPGSSSGDDGSASGLAQQQQQALHAKQLRCSVCGALQESSSGSSCMERLQATQQQQQCMVCGRPLGLAGGLTDSSSSSSRGDLKQAQQQQQLPGVAEIVPEEQPGSSSRPGGSGERTQLRGGWWQRLAGRSSSSSKQQQLSAAAGAGGMAGCLPGGWGPPLRPGDQGPDAAAGSSRADALWQRVHAAPQWCLSTRDASIGRSVMQAGELVFVFRPLVYVVLLRRYGLTSWRPWLASLALDLASGYGLHTGHAILERSNASKWPAGSTLYSLALLRALSSSRWSPGEQQELVSRRLLLLRYLLRSPCYTLLTRRLLLRAVAGSRYVPGMAGLAEFAFNMIEGMQALYSYVEV